MKITDKKSRWLFWVVVGINVFVFLLLAGKNPFSSRSLIPNLEPYPDTLFYSVPAWNLVQGKGFVMKAFGIRTRSIVPPLYSLFLVPFFAVFGDVRSFYFANLFLAIGTILIFALIVKKIFEGYKNYYLGLGAMLFFLVTNFYFYTLPALLMAENASLFLVMLGFYLFIKQKNLLLAVVGVELIFVKLSNFPIAAAFLLTGFIKILLSKNKKNLGVFLGVVLTLLLGVFMYFFKTEMLVGHQNLEKGTGLSGEYFLKNFGYYLANILGGKTYLLWYTHVWIDRVTAILFLLGLTLGLIKKSFRKYALWGLLIIFALIVFMSFFYVGDSRYLLVVFPICILFLGFLFFGSGSKIILIFGSLILYMFLNDKAGELKRQIGVNLRHREDPWNYMALKIWQPYLEGDPNSVLATFLPPFYVSLINGEKSGYLPISPFQEFSSRKDDFMTKLYSGSLVDKYRSVLRSGKNIYISDYYVSNNLGLWRKNYEEIVSNFKLKLVTEGCLGSCNLYRLE